MQNDSKKLRVSDQIYASLKEDIMLGRFDPSEKLTTERLAKIKNVSHTPVREALGRIAREGLVEIVPHQGAFVKKLSFEEAYETLQIREVMEVSVVGWLTERGVGPDVLKQLRNACDRFAIAQTLGEVGLADFHLHKTILKEYGSGIVARMLEGHLILLNAFRLNRELIGLQFKDRIERSASQHFCIVDAIASHNVELAKKTMKAHLEVWLRDLEKVRSAS